MMPVSLRHAINTPLKKGIMVCAFVFAFFVLWGGLAPIESAIIASGTLVPQSEQKIIQHLEGGVVRAILVHEGDLVKAKQALVLLNDTNIRSRKQTLESRWNASRILIARLMAERDQTSNISFSNDILEKAKKNNDIASMMDTQKRLFKTRQDYLVGQTSLYEQQIIQQKQQFSGFENQKKSIEDQIALQNQEIDMLKKVVAQGLAYKPRLLELERNKAELQGQLANILTQMANTNESMSSTKLQIINLHNQRMQEVINELKPAQQESIDLEEQLHATNDTLNRSIIRAPTTGIINHLQIHTVGGVIAPGAEIMQIIPTEDSLVVHAEIRPQDIDSVRPHLPARIMLTAYSSQMVPKLKGRVLQVSADSITEAQTGNSYYLAKISIDPKELKKLNSRISLYPGMPVEVFVETGSRSLLKYLFVPVMNTFYKALREP